MVDRRRLHEIINEVEIEFADKPHPAAYMAHTRIREAEDITELHLEVQFAAINPVANELISDTTEEQLRKQLRGLRESMGEKLVAEVRKWVDGS